MGDGEADAIGWGLAATTSTLSLQLAPLDYSGAVYGSLHWIHMTLPAPSISIGKQVALSFTLRLSCVFEAQQISYSSVCSLATQQ